MDMTRNLSIVVVFYSQSGAESFAKNNLASIEESGIETVIIENGEEKKKLLFPKNVKYIVAGENLGYGAAANRGIDETSSEYVLLMNDDVIITSEFLEKLIERTEFYRENRFRIVGFRVFSEKSKRTGIHIAPYSPFIILYHFSPLPNILSFFSQSNGYVGAFEGLRSKFSSKEVYGVNGSVMLLDRKFFVDVGGFDKDYFLTYEETDLFLRTMKRKGRIYYDSSINVNHMHSLTAGEESLGYSFMSMRIFLKKHYGSAAANFVAMWIFFFLMVKRFVFFKSGGRVFEHFKKSI